MLLRNFRLSFRRLSKQKNHLISSIKPLQLNEPNQFHLSQLLNSKIALLIDTIMKPVRVVCVRRGESNSSRFMNQTD